MKNNFLIIALLTILASFSMTACQSANAGKSSANEASANKSVENTNQEKANSSTNQIKVEENKTPENEVSKNSLDTPTAVYKAAHAARKNKDIEALKQLISKDMIEFFERFGEGKPNAADEGLKQLVESPQNPSDESRNEKIKGDKATLEYLDQNGKWKMMDFVKEDGKWKLTINKAE